MKIDATDAGLQGSPVVPRVVSVKEIKQRFQLFENENQHLQHPPLRRASDAATRVVTRVAVAFSNDATAAVTATATTRPVRFIVPPPPPATATGVQSDEDSDSRDRSEDVTVTSAGKFDRTVSVLDMAQKFGEMQHQQQQQQQQLLQKCAVVEEDEKPASLSAMVSVVAAVSPSRPPRKKDSSGGGGGEKGDEKSPGEGDRIQPVPQPRRWISGSSSGCDDEGFLDESNPPSAMASSPGASEISCLSDASVVSSAPNSCRQSPETTTKDEVEPSDLIAAPLPPGPPPKKPPRTFAHDVYLRTKAKPRDEDEKNNYADPGSKHSNNSFHGSTSNVNGVRRPRCPPPSPPRRLETSRAEERTNPYVDFTPASRAAIVAPVSTTLKRCRSEEHVYAVPYVEVGVTLRSKVSSPVYAEISDDRDVARRQISTRSDELHYSCVPVFTPRNNGATVVVVGDPLPPKPPPPPTDPPLSLTTNGSTVVISGPRPVCKKVSLKRRPPVNNKSWARRCLEKSESRNSSIGRSQSHNHCPSSSPSSHPSPSAATFGSPIWVQSPLSPSLITLNGDHHHHHINNNNQQQLKQEATPSRLDSLSSSSVVAANNSPRARALSHGEMDAGTSSRFGARKLGVFNKAEMQAAVVTKDEKRPPLPTAAKDRIAGLNLSIQSMVEKARKRVNFSKAVSGDLSPGGKTGGMPLCKASSSPMITVGSGLKTPTAGNETSCRTPSSSSSGAEDSDLTNDDEDDSEKEDNSITSPLSFTELRERWKERERVVENRKNYVRRVSRTVSSVYRKNLLTGCNNRVFDCLLVIGLYHDARRDVYKPYVRKAFPQDASYPENIAMFCFPDACNWRRKTGGAELSRDISTCNSYSIVLTSDKGERTFGYCRRIVPDSQENSTPLAYCLLSKIRAHGFYDKLMTVLTSRHGTTDGQMQTFLTLVARKQMPSPGQSISLPSIGAVLRNASPDVSPTLQVINGHHASPSINSSSSPNNGSAMITRALDERLEESDIAALVETLDHGLLMKIYGAVLLERKILLVSTSMKRLSSCVQGLSGLLYPFSWEHVLVPILPLSLKDVVTAPSPFLIGLLLPSNHAGGDFVRDLFASPELNSEGLLVVDVDKKRLVKSIGDESTILPRKVRKCLQTALSLVTEITDPGDPARNVLISEMFMTIFVELCGHYKNHISIGPDGKRVFQADTFLAAVKNSSSRLFLAWFVETAMFSIFIDNRVLSAERHDNDLFDYRALEHQSDGSGKNIFKTMKHFGKTVKTLSDKWKDWKATTASTATST